MDDKKRTGRGAKENIAIPTGELSRPLHAVSTRDAFQSFPMLQRPRNSNNPGGTDDLTFLVKALKLATTSFLSNHVGRHDQSRRDFVSRQVELVVNIRYLRPASRP